MKNLKKQLEKATLARERLMKANEELKKKELKSL
jgi:hypothetical protein